MVVVVVEVVGTEASVVVEADPHEVNPAVARTRAQRLARFLIVTR